MAAMPISRMELHLWKWCCETHTYSVAGVVCQTLPSLSEAQPSAFDKETSVAAKASPSDKPVKEFSNTNRYHVPLQFTDAFETEWKCREVGMRGADGFRGLSVDRKGEEYTVTSRWASIPQWEAYSCSPVARRSHLPLGVWQYVPKKGDGFPDDFIPFKDMTQPVNAKY
ncbi:unnamed protein product [Ostreobium quekettii]|uniref:ABM domain-containing protein n=1 Tax=Ostreobium quekettii TaxID=121088 RepID=A0A8S1IR91_9CHLO|nr:unnamed protein product [Ostreobium quekettii]